MTTISKQFGLARRTLGIILLATTVLFWTAGNFLLSAILADNSYSKPYFVTYVNTAFFSLFLVVPAAKRLISTHLLRGRPLSAALLGSSRAPPPDREEAESFLPVSPGVPVDRDHAILVDDGLSRIQSSSSQTHNAVIEGRLTTWETIRFAAEFCLFWFFANFTLAVGLEYTSVGSSTVLTATSSMWTLLLGTVLKVERFSLVKLFGVLISLGGIILISMVDLSGDSDKGRGKFPHKSPAQLALGDVLSLVSAVLYAAYTVLMKKRIGKEDKIDMVMFFGFIGLINTVALWPGMILLHYVGLESFELPPTSRVTYVVMLNSIISIVADLSWGYAVVLTTPLVVTVGLSMSIPLTLLGQMAISNSSSTPSYWLGALLVFVAFGLINHDSKKSEELPADSDGRSSSG